MIEVEGDIWHYYDQNPESWMAITTNAYVNKRGEAVMGRGIALQARQRFTGLAKKFGDELSKHKDKRIHVFPEHRIICFQVKESWWQDARLILIEQSCRELKDWMDEVKYKEQVFMVRPGCGNGRLQWEDVRPVLWKYFIDDDRLTIVEKSA